MTFERSVILKIETGTSASRIDATSPWNAGRSAGDKDWICNWLGNQEWTNKLDWYAHDEFASAELEPWYVDGKQAGEVKSVDGLTFLRVYDAGHRVPFNKPKQSLAFFDKWLAGDLEVGIAKFRLEVEQEPACLCCL